MNLVRLVFHLAPLLANWRHCYSCSSMTEDSRGVGTELPENSGGNTMAAFEAVSCADSSQDDIDNNNINDVNHWSRNSELSHIKPYIIVERW